MTVLERSHFGAAFRELINHAQWHKHETAFDLTKNGEYMYLTFAWQAYYFDDDIEPQSILVLEKAWAKFVANVRELSNGKLRFTRLSQVISSIVHEKLEYPDPLSEQALQVCIEQIHEVLELHLHKPTVVVVPLYNLRAEGADAYQACMPLANTVLYFQGSSVLKGEVQGGSESINDVNKLHNSCVLQVLVSGDRESQRALALQETSEALKVLRFVKRWTVAEVKQPPYFNPASFVSMWCPKAQLLVFYDPEADARVLRTGCYAHDTATISSDDVEYAVQFCGLDDINYHYANAGHPISDQITRALTFYDNGVLAKSPWEALHNYVVSVNVAVLSGEKNRQRLREDVETLIRHGGGYARSDYLASQLPSNNITKWEELVRDRAKPLEKFYRILSIVSHGGQYDYGNVSGVTVLQAREIAHNAVRLVAKLAREQQWSSHDEALNWFEAKRRQAKK